jgi:hypothetical protein
MNHRHDIEARIDAALAAQVRAPRLDRQFDAAVWRRIEAEQLQSARPSGAPARERSAARWLRACNAAGVVVAVVLLAYFGLQLEGGMAARALTGASWELPESWVAPASWTITACALAFGLRFTPLGRWVRAAFF